jgi:hypothetical protein
MLLTVAAVGGEDDIGEGGNGAVDEEAAQQVSWRNELEN